MKAGSSGVLLVLGILAATACGQPGSGSSAGARPGGSQVDDAAGWPDVDAETKDCLIAYPEDLREQPYAFDGTIGAVRFEEYDELEDARPVRLEIKVNELFRGEDVEDFVDLRTWDFMLPEEDVAGTRILAATSHSFDLQGCGYTRPYSETEAARWRQTFANVPSEECGKEVRDCGLGEPSLVPASCTRASFEYAIASQIDQGHFPFDLVGCNDRYLALRVDLGDCAPEATKQQRRQCAREKTAYFRVDDGMWTLLTYEERKRCSQVRSLDPGFPPEFCER
ncbi:MAG TPA: hypothetical protein VG929_09780 [Actinomycetota bacterium]|nr:hypothetical protein [Actinomycetota bacterium]